MRLSRRMGIQSQADQYEVVEFTANSSFRVPTGVKYVDIHAVGGGGGGANNSVTGQYKYTLNNTNVTLNTNTYNMGRGGGSGFVNTINNIPINSTYLYVRIGSGGATNSNGSTSYVYVSETASDMKGEIYYTNTNIITASGGISGRYGGNGGSGGGAAAYRRNTSTSSFCIGGDGGVDGSDGDSVIVLNESTNATKITSFGGLGGGKSTRDFGSPSGTLRANGGPGALAFTAANINNIPLPNGNGDGGRGRFYVNATYNVPATAGRPGIVLIRYKKP